VVVAYRRHFNTEQTLRVAASVGCACALTAAFHAARRMLHRAEQRGRSKGAACRAASRSSRQVAVEVGGIAQPAIRQQHMAGEHATALPVRSRAAMHQRL
jgi:hypothetical protein